MQTQSTAQTQPQNVKIGGGQPQVRGNARSHSTGSNNFVSSQNKQIKVQKNPSSGNGVFGTNNLMFGNYAPG